jgi:two-component system, NarL family, nitrate/nitrite response regulator NarL
MRVVLCDDHLLFAESFAAMLMSLGHEVVGILPFPLPGRAEERETAARMAAEADVCVIDPGAADLVELREDLRTLDGGVSDSQPREIGKPERTRYYINARRHRSGQADTQVIDAALDYSAPREEPCRFVVLTAEEHRSADSLRSLLEADIRGVISKRRSAAEIVEALTLVHHGGIYFDPDMVRRALVTGPTRTRPYAADLLTQRELEVLRWLAHGAATGEMAAAMGISAATVRSHIKAAMSKLEVSSRLQAAARAISLGLVDPPTAR